MVASSGCAASYAIFSIETRVAHKCSASLKADIERDEWHVSLGQCQQTFCNQCNPMTAPKITLIGGPTALIEIPGFRFLTDPTFDEPGEYKLPHVTLTKTSGPALSLKQIGDVDAVLLSHDQHSDNLDNSGRAFLKQSSRVLTTAIGAERLGGNVEGLRPWQSVSLNKPDSSITITATPARHGPAGIEPLAGDVIGLLEDDSNKIYVTGDTVWYDGVAEVARRFKANVVLLFAGSAQTRGPFHLTMDTNDAIEAAQAFPDAVIVPVHYEGWAYFKQSGDDLLKAFNTLGFGSCLQLLKPGVATTINPRRRAA
jgi:L-ascorbate metabolism protein UlaG (beta-lactamase superfamily)